MLQHLGCRKGNAGPQHVSERGGWRFVQSNTNARHVCVAQISTGPSSSNPINVDLKIQQTQLPRHSDAGSQSQQRSSQSYYRKTASKPSAVFSPSSASTPEELVMKLQQRIRSVTSDQPLFLQTMLFSEVTLVSAVTLSLAVPSTPQLHLHPHHYLPACLYAVH